MIAIPFKDNKYHDIIKIADNESAFTYENGEKVGGLMKRPINRLIGKMSDEDINLTTDLINKEYNYNKLIINLLSKKECKNHYCICNKYSNIVLPSGNVNSDIMFVLGMPTKIDGEHNTIAYDDYGKMLTIILKRLGISRNDVYITSICKCHCDCNDIYNLSLACSSLYLFNEIQIVKPKKIIAFGIDAINVLRTYFNENLNIVNDVMAVRGKTFIGNLDDNYFTVLQTVDINKIIEKSKSIAAVYKNVLWNDVKWFYNYTERCDLNDKSVTN